MLHLADSRPAVRQNLATGRVSERLTGRGLAVVSASLSAQPDAAPVIPLAARFLTRSEGYFAFSILPGRDLPNLAAATNVILQAEFAVAGYPAIHTERTVAGSAFALQETARTVAGQNVTLSRVSGAPIDLSVEIDPIPVALQGIVLHNHDPAQPAHGVHIVAGAASADTDAQGRFFIAALPIQSDIVLALTLDGNTTNSPFHIDYGRPVNSVTLSLPG